MKMDPDVEVKVEWEIPSFNCDNDEFSFEVTKSMKSDPDQNIPSDKDDRELGEVECKHLRRRGRPRKHKVVQSDPLNTDMVPAPSTSSQLRRHRGRSRKHKVVQNDPVNTDIAPSTSSQNCQSSSILPLRQSSPEKKLIQKKTKSPTLEKNRSSKRKRSSKKNSEIKKEPVILPPDWENWSPEQKKEWRNQLHRKRKKARRENLSAKEKEEFKARTNFNNFVRKANMTDEEKREKRMYSYMYKYSLKARMTEDQYNEYKHNNYIKQRRWYDKQSLESKKKAQNVTKTWMRGLTGEKLQNHKESRARGMKKYWAKMKEERPQEYELRMKQIHSKTIENHQNQVKTESPEQRRKRLLRYKIDQAKKKMRKKMREEGANEEEIQIKLKEIVEEFNSRPLPTTISVYKPRPRKNHQRKNLDFSEAEIKLSEFMSSKGVGRPKLSRSLVKKQPKQDHTLPTIERPGTSSTVTRFTTSTNNVLSTDDALKSTGIDDVNESHDYFDDDMPSSPPSSPGEPPCDSVKLEEFKMDEGDDTVSNSNSKLNDVPKPTLVLNETLASMKNDVNIEASPPHLNLQTVPDSPPQLNLQSIPDSPPQLNLQSIPDSNSTVLEDNKSSKKVEVEMSESSDSRGDEVEKKVKGEDIEVSEICDICGKVVKNLKMLKMHKELIHNSNDIPTTCSMCNVQCTSIRSLWNHFLKFHLPNKEESTEDDANNLESQSSRGGGRPRNPFPKPQTRGTDTINQCEQCGKKFKQKCTLDDHFRRVHQGLGFYCDLCVKSSDFQSAGKLWKHKVEAHGLRGLSPPPGAQQCDYCSHVIFRGYEAHIKQFHPEMLHKFQEVKKNKIKLYHNVRSQEKRDLKCSPESNTVLCPECNKILNKSALSRHLRNMHGIGNVKTHKCNECGKEFKDLYKLKEHFRDMHEFEDVDIKLEAKKLVVFDSSRKKADCLLCNTTLEFSLLSFTLRAHFVSFHHQVLLELLTSTEPLFQCELCADKFHRGIDLHSHLKSSHPDSEHLKGKVKTQIRKRGGNYCKTNPVTKRAVELEKFRTVCQKCNGALSLGHLLKHSKVAHKSEGTVSCEYCKKEFKKPGYWAAHVELIHGIPLEKVIPVATKSHPPVSRKKLKKKVKTLDNNENSVTCSTSNHKTRGRKKRLSVVVRNVEKDKKLVICLKRLSNQEIKFYLRE